MRLVKSLAAKQDPELHELMASTARNLVYTIAGLYLAWHIIATVGYPQIFSPSLWKISIYMAFLVYLTLHFIDRRYFLSQYLWLAGLTGAVLLAYSTYGQPAVFALLIFLPMIAVVTLGVPSSFLMVGILTFLIFLFIRYEALPSYYATSFLLGSVFIAIFGWAISSNLLSALGTASYHYNEARRLLEETRAHRAEISRILKDRNQVNYQLERANEMLVFARAQAEEARENRNRFMLAVSHELRSPLNFIVGFSDLMVNAPETYAPLAKWPAGLYDDVQEIYTSSRHLLRLINDILDMGKIDARQMTLYREKAQMEQIVEDVRDMIAPAFTQKGIELRIELPPDLPPVFVDTTRLRQVLLNLLNNALRFTDKGNVTLSVEIGKNNNLLVNVIDTGTGISSEDLPKVFDEFRQVGEEKWRRRAGTGLGLHISRQFIELHGGSMGVDSTIGQGTRVYFTLPLDSSSAEVELENATVKHRTGIPQVLLITKFAEDALALQRELDGYALRTISDVNEAIRETEEFFPSAILVAYETGNLDVEALPYEMPVIHFSLPRATLQTSNLHAQLVKPVSREALVETIHSLGENARHLLVIDDDPAMIRFVTQSFRADAEESHAENYVLFSAFSGEQAIELLHKYPVDAILLDLELPDINGWEWLKHIQSNPDFAKIPIVIISAQDISEINMLPGSSMLELSLRRPLSMSEMGGVVKAVLENIPPLYPNK